MSNYTIDKVKYGSDTFNFQTIYPVKGTQTTTTASWTGAIDIPALYDGLSIAYYLPCTSASNVTLNLTLSGGGTTGAIPVYYTGTTRMTTHYGAGSTVFLTYWSAGSISVNGTATTENRWTSFNYDSNTNNAVTQTATNTNANYEVLFSATADNTTRTEGARKYSNLLFNPSTGNLQATQLNGVTIGSSPKFTDTTYTPASATPLMDGTAAVGTSAKYAREDHVHPSDTSKAPIPHASTGSLYGTGASGVYGHVALSDATNGTEAAASGGTAATPKAVADALTAAKSYTDTNTSDKLSTDGSNADANGFAINNETNIDLVTQQGTLQGEWYYGTVVTNNELVKKGDLSSYAPKSHAASSTTYGGATASNYGHVKLSDSYSATGTAANSLAPSQKALSDGLAIKAPLASPALTGTPTAPTATAGTNTTQIATTAFVQAAYTNASLGQGYGICTTEEATAAKVVTLSNYVLTTGGVVVVKFSYGVPDDATMNINSKGAKPIYYNGIAIVEGIIIAGDIATFIYDGSYYHLISTDTATDRANKAMDWAVRALNAIDDMFYSIGDTITFRYTTLSGLVTGSTKMVRFTLPLPKSMQNVSRLTVTSLKGGIRGINGYINGSSDSTQWVGQSNITVDNLKLSTNLLGITITNTSAYSNVTNNTPVAAWFDTIIITCDS